MHNSSKWREGVERTPVKWVNWHVKSMTTVWLWMECMSKLPVSLV